MLIAREKKKNNLAEYILYMWQIEEIIRSNNFELANIRSRVIDEFDIPLEVKIEMENWYGELISEMQVEGIEKQGHLQRVKGEVAKLTRMHHQLLTVHQDKYYQELYDQAKGNIDALLAKSDGSIKSDIEACLTGLYGVMVLKLQGRKISEDTVQAIDTITKMMAYLVKNFHSDQREDGIVGERKN